MSFPEAAHLVTPVTNVSCRSSAVCTVGDILEQEWSEWPLNGLHQVVTLENTDAEKWEKIPAEYLQMSIVRANRCPAV